jgi:hypothetical protein
MNVVISMNYFTLNHSTRINLKTPLTYSGLHHPFQNAIQKFESFKSLPVQNLSVKPGPSAWSVAEIFEHILLFNNIYQKMIRKAIDHDDSTVAESGLFNARFHIRPLIAMMRPPYKFKIKTLSPMKPDDELQRPVHDIINDLITFNREQIRLIEELEEKNLDLDRIKGRNSVFKFKMTLTEFFLMMAAHQDRHIWQAEQTLERLSEH